MKKFPDLETIDEAVRFWETHDSTEYFGKTEEVTFDIDLHRNLVHPKAMVLTERPDHCPKCRGALVDDVIEYLTLSVGHLLAIRDIPAIRCTARNHEFVLEETLYRIEELPQTDKRQELEPTATMEVPVVSLEISG